MRKSKRDMTLEETREFITPESPCILEIGCNDGTDTNRFLNLYPKANVYCFEPDPRAIARYYETVNHPNAHLSEIALSDKGGIAIFYGSSGKPPERSRHPGASHYCYLDEWDLSGSLCKPTGHLQYSPWTTFPEDRQFQVETMRLDDWVSQTPSVGLIDFVWCDVQGAEAQVIRGATETLLGIHYFYTEFYDPPLYEGQLPLAELEKLLPTFELVGIWGDNALFKNRSL